MNWKGFFKDLENSCQPADLSTTIKFAKAGVASSALGCLAVAQFTLIGKVSTLALSPVLKGVIQGCLIGSSGMIDVAAKVKAERWIFAEDYKRQEAKIQKEIEIVKKMKAQLKA